jgi:phage shock protein A
MRLDIFHHYFEEEAPPWVDELKEALGLINYRLETIMADLTKLQSDVTAQTSVVQGVSTLLSQLSKEISDLKNQGTADPALQSAIDDLAAKVEANSQALADAVTANTPSA